MPETQRAAPEADGLDLQASAMTRVDPAHRTGGAASEPAPAIHESAIKDFPVEGLPNREGDRATPLEPGLSDVAGQMSLHTEQLTMHLRSWQEGLDRREAQLNAQSAAFDNEVRSARLWLDARREELALAESAQSAIRSELNGRQAELDARKLQYDSLEEQVAADHRARCQDLDSRQAVLQGEAARLTLAGGLLVERQRQFAAERQEVESKLALLKQQIDTRREASLSMIRLALVGLERRRQAIERNAESLARSGDDAQARERERAMSKAEEALAQGRAELAHLRQQCELERLRHQAEADAQCERLAEHRCCQEAELESKRLSLARMSDQLDCRRAALDHSQQDLARLHREALEHRLAAEELLVRLSPHAEPGALAQTAWQLRDQLQSQQQSMEWELAQRRRELESLCADLDARRQQLIAHKEHVETWLKHCQAELDQRAARLAARGRELDDQAAANQAAEGQWREERVVLMHELRRAQAQLRRSNVTAHA